MGPVGPSSTPLARQGGPRHPPNYGLCLRSSTDSREPQEVPSSRLGPGGYTDVRYGSDRAVHAKACVASSSRPVTTRLARPRSAHLPFRAVHVNLSSPAGSFAARRAESTQTRTIHAFQTTRTNANPQGRLTPPLPYRAPLRGVCARARRVPGARIRGPGGPGR